jgi:general stress protein YciG
MSKLSREFFREIGRKGGRGGKWSPAKRNSAQRAAKIRWARQRRTAQAIAEYKGSSST